MTTVVHHTKIPDRLPPASQTGTIAWIRASFFSSIPNAILTFISLYLLYLIIPAIVNWAVINATISGTDRTGCDAHRDGACWTFIKVRIHQIIFGLYYSQNPDQIWRPILMFATLGTLISGLLLPWIPKKLYIGIFTIVGFPFIAYAFIHGEWLGLPIAESDQWGGLMLTLILAFVGIVAAFPIGILMALGRQSELPIIRFLCVLYIELWRAAPLITILFMASVMIPLFFPAEMNFDKVLRAMIGISLFQSAYTAEAIRGGLQAIPKGQYEAADALGLNYWQKTIYIILPQALKIAIPGIVNTFITLFKDTSLVSIIALAELTGITRFAAGSIEWKGKLIEGYVFAAFIYWCFCFSMSKYAGNLEKKLNTSHRN